MLMGCQKTKHTYSPEARRLAELLGAKAASNLRVAGYQVECSSTGTWVVRRPGR
jgi:hypothetical protein